MYLECVEVVFYYVTFLNVLYNGIVSNPSAFLLHLIGTLVKAGLTAVMGWQIMIFSDMGF
jgi:hypothetical protein